MDKLNSVIPFIIAVTLVVTVFQHIFAWIARAVGLGGAASFFNPSM